MNKVLLLLFMILVAGRGLKFSPNPIQTQAGAIRKSLLNTFVPLAAGIVAISSKVGAEEVKGKFEYMPALQGLDYGKVRVYGRLLVDLYP